MLEMVLSGLVTGWAIAIAIPIGAVGAFLVTLASRTSFRVGAAGAPRSAGPRRATAPT